MRALLLSLLCVFGFAQLQAAVHLPVLDEALRGNADYQVVYLPEDVSQANRLIRSWNASADLSHQVIPTLDEFTSAVRGGPGPLAEIWAPLMAASADFPELVFPLFHDPEAHGVSIFLLPKRLGAERFQRAITQTWLAWGNTAPLRPQARNKSQQISFGSALHKIWLDSGFAKLAWGNYVMIVVGCVLLYLGIAKGFEPLLLVPIAAGSIFVNAMGADMMLAPGPSGTDGGLLWYTFNYGISTGIFPLLIFLGVGALTDFGPLLANPWMALMGGAAQIAIFGSFFLAAVISPWLDQFFPNVQLGFTLKEAGAIAIIGGADGPTSIYVASRLAPDLLGAIAVAAYSYMALVPIIQPPVMKALTNDAERKIMMEQRKPVSKTAKILFPIVVILLCMLTLPSAVPLIGMLMLGNLLRESGVTERLSKTAQNELINMVTILLGLSVGTKMAADKFLDPKTLLILMLGCIAFMLGTAGGVLLGKVMNWLSGGKINPLIGSAGVSAVPMAARVSHNVALKYNRQNMLLMHAMGPNVSGVIGSAVAAGILLALLG